VAKRPRFSRWRRFPGAFRTGEHRPPGTGEEIDRIILYVPTHVLDTAEILAEKAGVSTVQEYCAGLLAQAVENERIQHKVTEFEARRGPLEGLNQIANDPDYLAEWQDRTETRAASSAPLDVSHDPSSPRAADPGQPASLAGDGGAGDDEGIVWSPVDDEDARENSEPAPPEREPPDESAEPVSESDSAPVPVPVTVLVSPVSLRPTVVVMSDRSAMEVVARHVAVGEDECGFLPCLRRGVPVPSAKVAELIGALDRLEREYRGAMVLDRRLAHALHRLALESQVLLTDAWPGVFNERVITAIRTVQESVERILSGEDVGYYPSPSAPPSEPLH
jgi:hypothetical protein